MTLLLFDSGPIITLTLTNALHILRTLKQKHNVRLAITEAVCREIVDNPFETKQFKFEAFQVQHLIDEKILEVINVKQFEIKTQQLLNIGNNLFSVHGNDLTLLQYGEIETIIAALENNADAIIVDERVTLTLLDNPADMQRIIQRRLHSPVLLNKQSLIAFKQQTKGLRAIRSAELLVIAYEQGLFDEYLQNTPEKSKELLEAILWRAKLNGCALTDEEINQLVELAKHE